MLKMSFLASSLVALGLLSSSAFAAQGAYVSLDAGSSIVEGMPSADTYGYYNSDLEQKSTAFGLMFGYSKDMNPNFGFGGELGYKNYGSQTYQGYTLRNYQESLEYKYSSIDLLAKLTWHVAKTFDLYGKVGIANEMVNVSGNDSIENNNQVLPEIGLGMSYFATDNLSLDLSVYGTQGNDVQFSYEDANNLPSITSVFFGVSYYFS